ncbi:uncharacterized protein LOC135698317 isoform X2 [Ochlerotatus camptorhynchus]|uniref:uncharacterized protein LOC135698317 isoform X2 n=1 Tax=Ochlerotatus camptorhynchus TaxID=644619 RepID=UPI0031DEFF3B
MSQQYDELNVDGSLVEELDDAYAYEYFRKFEPNPYYDGNSLMPVDDGSAKSSNALRQHCKERGLSFIRQNGIEQPARQIKEACICRRLCYMKFLDDIRSKLLSNLLGLSAEGQIMFLSSHITTVAVRRPSFKYCRRKSVHIYHLPSNSGRIQVCMRMFANTFDITDKKLRILNEKIHTGSYDYLANKSTTHVPNDDVTPLPSASNCDDEEAEPEEDSEPYESHASIDFIEIPQMRDLGDMEEYFLRYETDVDFQSRTDHSILQSKLGKQTVKKMLAERQYRKAKGYRYIRRDGTEAPARKLKPACSCRLMCCRKISNDARQVLLNNLLNLSVEGQENLIYSHMHLKNTTHKKNWMDHFLPTTSGLVKVCKVMFLNTFDLSEKKMRVLLAKKRRENQDVLGVDNPEEAAVDLEPSLPRRNVAACEEDTRDDIPKKEADDEIEIEHSYELLKAESEDESNDSNIAVDEESVPALEEALKSAAQHNCTVVSIPGTEVALDDDFLDQYFYRYETNFGLEEPTNNKAKCKNKLVPTDTDNTFQPCSCVTYGCSSWFTKDLHQKMFSRYSRLSALNKKRFLYRHIRKENKQRNNKYQSRRNFSMYYFLPTKKGHVKVCKVMFMNTFKVTDRKLRSIVGSEKYAEPPKGVTTKEENTYVQEEPADVVNADVVFLEKVSCDVAQKDADIISDSGTDNVKNSVPLETLISQHFYGGSDEAVKAETGDETEINRSQEGFKPESEDAINENNSMAVDEELDIPALNEPMENTEQGNCIFEGMSQLEEESDDVFLDQYFYRYETNFGQEEPTKNKDKSMRKCWSFNEADERPSEPCTCVTFNCSSWFTDDLRQKMFTRYARLSPLNKKRFLYRHIRKEHKRRNNKYQSRRNFSMFYFVPTKKGYVKVCKVMFMNTFKVTDKKLRTIVFSGKFSDPSEETTNEDHTCIKLDPDDFLIDIDENFMGEVSNDISCNDADKTAQLNSMIEIDPESCSTNQYSNVTDDSTESCDEDDKLPSNDIDNVVGVAVTCSKQLQPVVDLDDNFLTEYFIRYETNSEKPEPAIGKPRKIWIKHDTSGAILPPCSCPRKCYALYPDDVRREIYTRFTKLSTLNQKRFLFRHIRLDNPHRRKKNAYSRRQKSWFYYLPAKSGHVKICRVMFMSTFKVTEKKLRHLVQRKQFAEHASDEDDQNAQHVSTNVRYGSPCDDLSEDHNLRTEGIDNASNQTKTEHLTEEYSEYENYFSEVSESAVEPLLSILGCSMNEVNRFHSDTSTVAELDENFLLEYFHHFGSNVAGEKLGTKLESHGNTFPAPKILPPIACACHRKCHIKFPDKIRQMILDRYAELSVENRFHFLTSHVKKETPVHSVDEQSTQSPTCFYYLPSKSGHIKVCNIMFLNTFNINENELRELIFCEPGSSQVDGNVKIKDNPIEIKTEHHSPLDIKIENDSESEKSTEMIVGDYDYGQKDDHSNSLPEQLLIDENNGQMCMPGTSRQNETNSKQPEKMSNGAIRFAKEHICSFPRITSHFCQVVSKTKYLSCFLDVTSMYIAYINACTESFKEPVPSKVYTAILQNERTKDPALPSTCDVCQHVEQLDPTEDNSKFWYEDVDAQNDKGQ